MTWGPRTAAILRSRPAGLSRKSTELERKVVQLQQQMEGKNPAFIKLREEISHVQKRRLMHEKSLGKVCCRMQCACRARVPCARSLHPVCMQCMCMCIAPRSVRPPRR